MIVIQNLFKLTWTDGAAVASLGLWVVACDISGAFDWSTLCHAAVACALLAVIVLGSPDLILLAALAFAVLALLQHIS